MNLSVGSSSEWKLKSLEEIVRKDEYLKKTVSERWKITTDTIRNVDRKRQLLFIVKKK